MGGNVPFGVASATEIERHRWQSGNDTATGGISINFRKHAKMAWPFKTTAHIASIGNISERHAARVLSGEFEAPATVASALIAEIFKRV